MRTNAAVIILLVAVISGLGCGSAKPEGNSIANSATVCKPPADDTPTDAYKRLYAAVKARDIEGIKKAISKGTMGLAQSASQMQKKPIERVLENGFTATTFSETLPEIRDERISECMGAVEVWNSKESKWEDLPFVAEDGTWKLGVGDVFANTYKSPGKGRAQKEGEAANAVGNGTKPAGSEANNPTRQGTNSNAK